MSFFQVRDEAKLEEKKAAEDKRMLERLVEDVMEM
jgi:hypothetical protein